MTTMVDKSPPQQPCPAGPSVRDFEELVRELTARGWHRLPVHPRTAAFLGVHMWVDGSNDIVTVFDLDAVHARREDRDGAAVWMFDGDVIGVRHALRALPPPGSPAAPHTPLKAPPPRVGP